MRIGSELSVLQQKLPRLGVAILAEPRVTFPRQMSQDRSLGLLFLGSFSVNLGFHFPGDRRKARARVYTCVCICLGSM